MVFSRRCHCFLRNTFTACADKPYYAAIHPRALSLQVESAVWGKGVGTRKKQGSGELERVILYPVPGTVLSPMWPSFHSALGIVLWAIPVIRAILQLRTLRLGEVK